MNHDFVEATVRAKPEAVRAAIAARLPMLMAETRKFQALSIATPDAFPNDFELSQRVEGNPALGRYAAVAPERRIADLYVRGFDGYWQSEYRRGDKRVDFRTDFIIHLGSTREGDTRVEVIEFLPRVNLGLRFRACRRHGPGEEYDVRAVEPTTSDRVEMLNLVLQAAEEATMPSRNPN